MKSKTVRFKNKEGISLSATLELPLNGKPVAYAIFAHCFTCNKNFNAPFHISKALTLNKIGVLKFDFTGLGESEGKFSDTNFSSNSTDIVSAAEFLKNYYAAPQLLIGHSLGGTATLLAAKQIKSAKAVVTIGSPADPDHVMKHFKEDLEEIMQKGHAKVTLGKQSFLVKKQFVEDLKKADMDQVIGRINKALLILHSPSDKTVGINNAAQIYTKASHSKSFVSLDNADHFLSDRKDAIYTGNLIASWAERYLKIEEPELLLTEQEVVTKTTDEGYTTEIQAGKHTLFADEPKSVGGDDLGPDPYALLNAALGACTGMTLQMYASRKKWDLKEVKVHLSHTHSYADDCLSCKDKNSKIDKMERIIEVSGKLSEDQKSRLLEIANKCPVHKTLLSDITINSSLK